VVKTTKDADLIQPFKDDMEVYLADSRATMSELQSTLKRQRDAYIALVVYFIFSPKRGVQPEEVPPGSLEREDRKGGWSGGRLQPL
jgi:hypothetical protein